MQLSAVQLAEHDEELPAIVSAKGDTATYKVNHHTKQVWMKTGENDGNEKLWRLTGGSYDSIMALAGRGPTGQPVGDVPVSATAAHAAGQSQFDPSKVESLDPFGRPTAESVKEADEEV